MIYAPVAFVVAFSRLCNYVCDNVKFRYVIADVSITAVVMYASMPQALLSLFCLLHWLRQLCLWKVRPVVKFSVGIHDQLHVGHLVARCHRAHLQGGGLGVGSDLFT
jgi:hypothetical protein